MLYISVKNKDIDNFRYLTKNNQLRVKLIRLIVSSNKFEHVMTKSRYRNDIHKTFILIISKTKNQTKF